MKLNFNKKNYSTAISLLFLVFGTIAIVTANKIYRLGTQPIAPTAPKSVPAREPAAPCRFSFSVPASTPTPTSSPSLLHNVDQPQPNISCSSPFDFSGWTIWNNGQKVQKVEFYMDLPKGQVGKYGQALTDQFERADLCRLNPLYCRAGWKWRFNPSLVNNGPHKVYVYAYDADRGYVGEPIIRNFVVAAPTPTVTPTPAPTATITPTPTGSLTCDQRCLALHGGNAKYLGNCEPPNWTPPGCSHIICRTPRVIDPNKTFERILIGENPQGANDCLGSQICYCYTCEEKTCSVPAPTPTPG